MEIIVLAAILVVTLAALARIVWGSVRAAHQAVSPGCRGCPLAAECGSNDARHGPGRVGGADHER